MGGAERGRGPREQGPGRARVDVAVRVFGEQDRRGGHGAVEGDGAVVPDDEVGGDQQRAPVLLGSEHGDRPAGGGRGPGADGPRTVGGGHIGVDQQRGAETAPGQFAGQPRQDGVEPGEQRTAAPGGADQHQAFARPQPERGPVAFAGGQGGGDPVVAAVPHHLGDRQRLGAAPAHFGALLLVREGEGGGHHPAVPDDVLGPQTGHRPRGAGAGFGARPGFGAGPGRRQLDVPGPVRQPDQRPAQLLQALRTGREHQVELPSDGLVPGQHRAAEAPDVGGGSRVERVRCHRELDVHPQVGAEQRIDVVQPLAVDRRVHDHQHLLAAGQRGPAPTAPGLSVRALPVVDFPVHQGHVVPPP